MLGTTHARTHTRTQLPLHPSRLRRIAPGKNENKSTSSSRNGHGRSHPCRKAISRSRVAPQGPIDTRRITIQQTTSSSTRNHGRVYARRPSISCFGALVMRGIPWRQVQVPIQQHIRSTSGPAVCVQPRPGSNAAIRSTATPSAPNSDWETPGQGGSTSRNEAWPACPFPTAPYSYSAQSQGIQASQRGSTNNTSRPPWAVSGSPAKGKRVCVGGCDRSTEC